MDPIDTFEHAGLTVEIVPEEYIESWMSPRDRGDGNLGVMFCRYDRYHLGDQDAPDPRDQRCMCQRCDGSGNDPDGRYILVDSRIYGREIVKVNCASLAAAEGYMERHMPAGAAWYAEPQSCPVCEGEGVVEVSIVEYLKREHGARVILPLFVYEHSGITMSCGGRLDNGEDDFDRRGRFRGGDAWDTSSVGVIFDTAETRKRLGVEDWTDEQILDALREEVRYYAAYLENQVYYYVIKDADGEVLDSCGGMLDPDISDPAKSYVYAEAHSAARECAKAVRREAEERFRWACADVITV